MSSVVSSIGRSENAPAGLSAEEWQLRIDLAAAYQLAAIYGWTDLNNTHFSARVPGPEHHFLLNPFGMLFDEITASSLIKVDRTGRVVGGNGQAVNPAGFIIHGAIHMALPRAHCVIHTHSRFGTAVAMQKQGLLPASQKALTVMGWLNYHDFEGPALDASEQPRIVADLGTRNVLVLRNHGLLSVGETVGEAFVWMYRIETACRQQIDALSGGGELAPLSQETQQRSINLGLSMYAKDGFNAVGSEWPALLRQLERHAGTGYRS